MFITLGLRLEVSGSILNDKRIGLAGGARCALTSFGDDLFGFIWAKLIIATKIFDFFIR